MVYNRGISHDVLKGTIKTVNVGFVLKTFYKLFRTLNKSDKKPIYNTSETIQSDQNRKQNVKKWSIRFSSFLW